jgi:N-acetylglucosaminyl-diphospho-decaprenol L-rhamnosyltransferase
MTNTVAIVNWNSGHRLRACIESLLATTTAAEILIIDNASTDASLESVEGFRNRVHFVRNSVNRGFAAAVNQAFHSTSTSYVLVLNPDVRAMPGTVSMLEDFLDGHPRAAAIGGNVGEKYWPRTFPTVAALVRENLGLAKGLTKGTTGQPPRPPEEPMAVDQPAGAALMIRRDAYDEVGGFDEQFYPAWYEDVDFCERLKAAGWEIYFAPEAQFLHEGGYTAKTMGSHDFLMSYYGNQFRYARKHFGATGAAVVRASMAAGLIARVITRPGQAGALGKTLIKTLKGW